MPKLKDLMIRVESNKDRNLVHEAHYPLSVTTDGLFKATIEEGIVSAIEDAAKEQPKGEIVRVTNEYVRGSSTTRWVAEAKNKSWLVAVFKRYGEQQLLAEVTSELRIFFEHTANASFWLRADGSIAPNGQGEPNDGEWYGERRMGQFGPRLYQIGVGASVIRVTKTTPASGDPLFKYQPAPEDDLGPQGLMLKRFVHMPSPSAYRGEEETKLKSVPYTEANAAFFVNALMALCQLTQRFDNFFGSDDVAKLIATATSPMLPAPSAPVAEIGED